MANKEMTCSPSNKEGSNCAPGNTYILLDEGEKKKKAP